MNNNEAKKFIDGRILELACKAELPMSAKQRKRFVEEFAFFKYARDLYNRKDKTAQWKVFYEGDETPSCTSCGMGAPYARYKRKNGHGAGCIADYCPNCGAKMTGIDECVDCPYSSNGEWRDNGICFACRGDTWVYGKKHNERLLEDTEIKVLQVQGMEDER